MPEIPSRLETVAESRDALIAYSQNLPTVRNPGLRGLHLGADRPVMVPFENARRLIANLDAHGGLGPVVRVNPDDGRSYLVGHSSLPENRTDLPLRLPAPRTTNPVADLAQVTAAAGIVHALHARVVAVADGLHAGRTRQVGALRAEAASLAAFGHELVDLIPLFGEMFCDQWTREATARGEIPPPPSTNPVNLR